jgi:hypothetical protein
MTGQRTDRALRLGGSLLHRRQCLDEVRLRPERLTADREVLDHARGVRAPVQVGRDVDVSDEVVLAPRHRHHRAPNSAAQRSRGDPMPVAAFAARWRTPPDCEAPKEKTKPSFRTAASAIPMQPGPGGPVSRSTGRAAPPGAPTRFRRPAGSRLVNRPARKSLHLILRCKRSKTYSGLLQRCHPDSDPSTSPPWNRGIA